MAFGLLFAGTLASWLRRRDPLIREVALAFSGLAALLLLEIARQIVEVPAPVGRAAVLLLLAQPIFTLRLLDRIRPMPARLLPVAYIVDGVLFAVLLALPAGAPGLTPLALIAVGVFVVLDVLAAGYLVAESRRRSGAARMRLFVAGSATALLAIAIFVLVFGLAGEGLGAIVGSLARVIALVAAVGYALAFLPPAFLRRSWQADAAYRLGRRLLETADAVDPAHAWHRLVELATQLTGAEAAVVRSAEGAVRSAIGIGTPRPVSAEALSRLTAVSPPPLDLPLAEAGPPWTEIGAAVDARFITVVPITAAGARRSVLLIYGRRRSLFAEDDRALLAALGTQAAILAERAALAADLHRTVDELQRANAAKSDFLASMSHELRTPLNAIIGFSELMRMESPDADRRIAVPTEWVDHVSTAGQHLLDLINDVLDLAKVEAGRLDLERARFDLDAAALEWIGGVRPLADRKGVRLTTVGRAGTVEADRGRLRQIVYNLLSNAIKFTPGLGEVRLELARDGNGVRMAVVDTGIGIAPEDHEAVFEEFRQVGRPSDRQPGTGLGLALTRRLVEAHGGRIGLESALGEGSRFTIHLPDAADAAPVAEPPREPVVPASPTERRILVIEDDPGAVRLLRESLAPAGWRVVAAGDGPSGLAEARARRPDAIVLDVLLPGMDGWDVLRTLKADDGLRDVPVLMLTVVDEREIGLALGAADYLVKPVERAALLDRLARFTFTTKVKEREVRVLVVDDDPRAVEAIAGGLEQEGFAVTRAHGGREAMDLARNAPPDVVVCDLVMPDIDGFALVRALKTDPTTRHAPILVVTGHDISPADKARLNGDILGVIEKGAELAEGLRRWLGHVAAQADGRQPT